MTKKPTCRVVRGDSTYYGRQGLTYNAGIAAESVGATGICMHLVRIPPGASAKAHLHEAHETAIYVLSGSAGMWYGDRLDQHLTVRAGSPALQRRSRYSSRGAGADRPERARERGTA